MTGRRSIQEILARHEPLRVPDAGAARAAVLVPLRPEPGKRSLELFFTRRAADLGAHAGQVSFPGGHIEAHDANPEAAALRETFEELAVPELEVAILGRLDEMHTITGFHIVPVVGMLAPQTEPRAASREVAHVFSVPLAALLNPAGWQQREHTYGSRTFRVWHFPFAGEEIWGVTAAILRGFVELLWRG